MTFLTTYSRSDVPKLTPSARVMLTMRMCSAITRCDRLFMPSYGLPDMMTIASISGLKSSVK